MRFPLMLISIALMTQAHAQPHPQSMRQIQVAKKNVAINPVISGSAKTKVVAGSSNINGKNQQIKQR